MIEVVIPSSVQKIVTNKYVRMYQNLRCSQGRAYPRAQLINNIRITLSINGDYIEPSIIRNPIIQDWKAKGYRVIPFRHWFYAVQLRRMPNGETAAVAVDARYEGDYHDDTMQTKPYNESIIRIKESQSWQPSQWAAYLSKGNTFDDTELDRYIEEELIER